MFSKSTMSVRGMLGLACAGVLVGVSMLAPKTSAATIYGIDDQNNLFTFDNLSPQNIITGHFITGLAQNEHLLNIDFRPSNGVLYGIGSTGQVYTLNPATGAAIAVGAPSGAPSGNSFGMDVDPVNDNIRFVSDTDINQRISPTTGAVLGNDPLLHYSTTQNPSIVGLAYTNSTNPAPASTTLYGIDSVSDTLVQVNGSTGLLTPVGSLGTDTGNFVGFDISANNIGFASLLSPGSSASHLYAIDLTTGHALDQGTILGGLRVVDIATEPNVNFIIPEPGSILAISAMALCAGMRRRRV
jgi:hypothetical protein